VLSAIAAISPAPKDAIILERQAGAALHQADALDDGRVLQEKSFGAFAAQAERNGLCPPN